MDNFKYSGTELDLFEHATNWKKYWSSKIANSIKGNVLEVGAGTGSNTLLLFSNKKVDKWVSLEPDTILCNQAKSRIGSVTDSTKVEFLSCYTSALAPNEKYNSILYIDVLEHIENDYDELLTASRHLHEDGTIIILSPAHNFLFSPFDKAIGHYRRYNKKSLSDAIPKSLTINKMYYIDSVGLIASAANRFMLKSKMPNPTQINLWDKLMVPASRVLDLITGFSLGKSIVCEIKFK